MKKKLLIIAAFSILAMIWTLSKPEYTAAQDSIALYKNNNCVTCHSRLMNPLALTSRYAEWHMSAHKENEVGCEKCHGGDPAISDQKTAHKGVLPPKDAKSRLYPTNLPETCMGCHPNIVSSFIESKHFQNLKTAGLGPTCTTCHAHMASNVIYTPEQTSQLCSSCHLSPNTLLPRRPEIPEKAGETMQAIQRANMMTGWADRLLEEAEKRKMEVTDAKKEIKIVRAMLAEAKTSWHAFNLDIVRKKSDAAYEAGVKLKDELRGRLYPDHK